MTVVGNIPGNDTFNTETFDVNPNINVTGEIADHYIIMHNINQFSSNK